MALALALLMGLQPVTTDLYLPALPLLMLGLQASTAAAQMTMSAVLLSFGIGQLMWGPLADRIGRRPVLLAGLTLYTVAGLGAALAGQIEWLIGWRLLQGLGMAAAVVCARALVRDLYEPQTGAQVMAWGLTGVGLVAIASPTLGGAVAAGAGWRVAMALVAAAGAIALAFVFWQLPETLPRRRSEATRPAVLWATWRRIAVHPVFVAWAALSACTYGGLFVMLAGGPFVYIGVLGLSPAACGLLLGSASLSYIGGTFACRHWVRLHGPVAAAQRGALFTLAGGLSLIVLALLGVHSAWAIAVPAALYAVGHGVLQPCSQSGVVSPFPAEAGAASALAGFGLATVAFVLGLWLGQAMDGTPRPLAYGMGGAALLSCAVTWLLVRRLAKGGDGNRQPRTAAAQ